MKIDTEGERESAWAAAVAGELTGRDGCDQGPLWSTLLAHMPRLESPTAQVWSNAYGARS